MRKFTFLSFLFIGLKSFSQFTPGNLAFLQADASASNTTCSVIEINTTAAAQSAITTVAIDGTGANALRFSGSATSTGYLANSNDGTLLCFTGANNINTSANVNTLNPRGVGTLNVSLLFNLATTYTGSSGNQTRCATSLDNAVWFIGDQGGFYSNGTSSASPSGNIRSVKSFGGTVYAFTASASLAPVGTITSATGGTYSGLPGLGNGASSRQDFYLISSGSNGSSFDILYILDATSNTAGTILKYSLVSGSWTANGSYTTTFGGFGMAVQTSGGGASIYVSTGQGAATANSIIKVIDAAGYNATINVTTANNVTLYTAPAGKIIKGVAFTPIAAVSPSVIPNPVSINFGNVNVGATSTGQTVSLTAANLTPSSGSLTVTAPNSNFEVSNDGTSWSNSITVLYSNSGSTIGNFKVRFSPQSSGVKSGNVAITGGGLSSAATVAVTGTGDNALSLTFSTATTPALNPPYISSTINDGNDPVQQQGIITDVKENGTIIPAIDYTLTAISSNTTVVPNANILITKADGQATVKITPAAVGYSDITLTLTKGSDTKTLDIHCAASMAAVSAGTHWHTSFADASAAIALDDDYMIVADDESNLLYVFNRNQSGLPVKTYDYNQGNILNLTDGSTGNWKEIDVEASVRSVATVNRTYWLGSMSNSSSFNDKPNRNRLFAVDVTGTGSSAVFGNAGSYANLRSQLLTWGDAHGYDFTTSAQAGHDPKAIDGFNAEGMVFGPDNTTLYIGLRAPLVPVGNRTKAVIAPLQNFETWFNNGAPSGNPAIGSPIELDLGTRGIRDMIRLSNGNYIIVAGSYGSILNPAVYKWTGNATDAPVLLSSFDVSALNIEGVMQINEGGQISLSKLQFISDDGDRVFYGDGIAAKDLPQNNFKKFSSDIVTSSGGGVLPVQFEYFTAIRQANGVLLTWKTGDVANVSSFDVYRSFNGRDFTLLNSVNAVVSQFDYSMTDDSIGPGSGNKIYYRIKAKEITNNIYWSAVRSISLTVKDDAVKIYPNPVVDNYFSIVVNGVGIKKVEIYTANAVLYKQYQFSQQAKDINTSGWPKGSYWLRVYTNDKTLLTQKLIVQ